MTRVIYPRESSGKKVLAYYQSVHFFACVTIHTVIYDSWKETHLFVVLVKLAMFISPRWLSSSCRVLAECATVRATPVKSATGDVPFPRV